MKKTGVFKNCEVCTKPYWAFPYNADKRRWCSTKCHSKVKGAQISATKRAKSKISVSRKSRDFDSIFYKEWRSKCLVRDNMTCQQCSKNISGKNMGVVHHIKQWSDYADLRYDVGNGISLCRGCHNRVHVLPNRKIRSGF